MVQRDQHIKVFFVCVRARVCVRPCHITILVATKWELEIKPQIYARMQVARLLLISDE